MATIEELEQQAAAKQIREVDAEFVEDDETDENAALIYNDLVNSMSVLKKAALLMMYVSDTDLCKTVTKRERSALSKLSRAITAFVNETEESYETE